MEAAMSLHERPDTVRDLHRAIALVLGAGGVDHTIRAFVVEGEPVAKARARQGRQGFYTPSRTSGAEQVIAKAAQMHGTRFDGNVALGAVFYRSNRHRVDVDNLMKTVLDGITRSKAVWDDDSHVTALVSVIELDVERPRTAIALAHHVSTLTRGVDSLTHVCGHCGERYRPHQSTKTSLYCSRVCRTAAEAVVCVCETCGGPTSRPYVRRCRACANAARVVVEITPVED